MDDGQLAKRLASATLAKTKSRGILCTCHEYGSVEEELADIDILFLGHATGPAVAIGSDEDGLEVFATPFDIAEALTGSMPPKVRLIHNLVAEACGMAFTPGEQILWCAYRAEESSGEAPGADFYTDGCAQPQFALADYRRVLG